MRARQTAEIVFGRLEPQPEILAREELYLAAGPAIRQVIARAGGTAAVLAVVGHNPGLHTLARELAGNGAPLALARLQAILPPCALAQFALPIDDWRQLPSASGRLVGLWLPGEMDQLR